MLSAAICGTCRVASDFTSYAALLLVLTLKSGCGQTPGCQQLTHMLILQQVQAALLAPAQARLALGLLVILRYIAQRMGCAPLEALCSELRIADCNHCSNI